MVQRTKGRSRQTSSRCSSCKISVQLAPLNYVALSECRRFSQRELIMHFLYFPEAAASEPHGGRPDCCYWSPMPLLSLSVWYNTTHPKQFWVLIEESWMVILCCDNPLEKPPWSSFTIPGLIKTSYIMDYWGLLILDTGASFFVDLVKYVVDTC